MLRRSCAGRLRKKSICGVALRAVMLNVCRYASHPVLARLASGAFSEAGEIST